MGLGVLFFKLTLFNGVFMVGLDRVANFWVFPAGCSGGRILLRQCGWKTWKSMVSDFFVPNCLVSNLV